MIRQARRRPPSLRPIPTKRAYHSYEHERTSPFTPPEHALLSASLAQVPKLGFTVDALAQGARDAGYRDLSINLFPAGPFALVRYHLITQRRALATKQVEQDPSVDSKIRSLALERLRANITVIDRWQEVRMPERLGRTCADIFSQALALMAIPSHFPPSLRELALLADEILFLAGDQSVNTSWYTKRLALSTVYASSELFMTTDKSPNFTETEAFLTRRLHESNKLGASIEDTGTWLGVQSMGLVNGLRSKGLRI